MLVAVACGGATVSSAQAQEISESTVRSTVESELSSWSYQTDLPRARPEQRLDIDPVELPTDLIEVIFWIGVGIAAVVAAFWLYRYLKDLNFKRDVVVPVEEAAPSEQRPSPRNLLAEADRLAGEGRFGEAVHLLLIGTLGGFAERGAAFVSPPLTSREVLAEAPLKDTVKAALRELVVMVERAHFAGRSIGQGDFRRARDSYASIAGDIAAEPSV